MNLNVLQQLPTYQTYRYFYERYKWSVVEIINPSTEFTYIWTHMNVPFNPRRGIEKLIKNIDTLKRYPVNKIGEAFWVKVKNTEKNLDVGVD